MIDYQDDEADPESTWPVPGICAVIRTVIDGLHDAVAVCDGSGMIRHANPAATQLLGWRPGGLDGQSVTNCLPEYITRRLAEGFEALVEVATKRAGRPMALSFRHQDGGQVPTDVVLSVLEHPWAGRAIVAVIRPRRDRRIERLGRLSSELVEILAAAPANETPAERLLSTLGHRLRWDVATLWVKSPTGTLVCRHVWTREPGTAPAFVEEKAKDPTSGSDGMPHWVIDHGEPLWVPDLADDEEFATRAVRSDGLQSAYAFPIRYRGTCVGVVKMLSRRRREPDPGLVELMAVVSGQLGEILNAAGMASERERLVAELEEVRRSQEFLLLASRVLSEATDYRQTVERLAQVAVPVLADLCLIDVRTDDGGDVERMAAWHADPSKRGLAEQLRVRFPPEPSGTHPSIDVMYSGRSRWDAEMSDEFLRATSRDEEHLAILKALEFTSYMTVPLMVEQRALGTVTLVSAGSGRRFGAADLTAAEELASQVASVVERARVLDRERQISHELQKSLLPASIPEVEGWAFSTRYVPAAQGVEVGGDWFDVVPVGGGLIAVMVGDVEGHDMEAAKVMGRLRHILSLLLVEERSPGPALDRLNRYVLGSDVERIATVLVGMLDENTGSVGFASAGHSFGLIVGSDGVRDVGIRPGPPLGAPGGRFDEHQLLLGNDCLVLFTDGLIEQPGVHLDHSLALLRAVAGSAPSNEPERLADRLLEAMLQDGPGGDDIALLAMRRRPDSR